MPGDLIKILIIDDDAVDRDVFKRYLNEAPDAGYIFDEATSGRDGINRCAAFQPDCILLDYILPDMDGLTFLRSLNTSGSPPYAIVMLTAIGNERVAVDAMKAGVMDYATKGAAAADSLHHTIRNAIQKFQMQREIEGQRAAIQERNLRLEQALKRESTARHEAEASRQRYEALLEAIPQIVWSSTPEGATLFANARWFAYTGLTRDASGRQWTERIHPDDRPGVTARWQSALDEGNVFETEARLQRHDGGYRWHLLRGVPFPDQIDGAWLCTGTDVADQKQAQEALLQQQKLDSIGLLAGGVAHDFNNLLVGIMGASSLAMDSIAPSHPVYPLLRTIEVSSERAADLTRQLLAYAGKGRVMVEPVDLTEVALRTSELVRAMIPKIVQITLQLHPDLPSIQSDAGQMQQVVMNLMINAAEAMAEGESGLIVVRTASRTVGTAEKLVDGLGDAIPPGSYVALEVVDTGSGMTEGTRRKIFDPFFTTKFPGRGLGLAAVQGIVRMHRGAIQVETAPGMGSTFRVLFPAQGTSTRPAPAQPEDPAVSAVGSVLVIDDEAVVRNIVETSLRRAGYTVRTAASGREGIAALREDPDITFVLLDMSMPEMSGPETIGGLRSVRPGIPVIVCSGFTDNDVRRAFHGYELTGVIRKPFTAQSLLAQVDNLLAVPASGKSARPANRAI
jgi:two-component system cell cycle sensor histidine kinase/response regulator CckA